MRQLGVIEDGALLISDGIITNVGPTRRIENLAEARAASEEINASGRVVMPGFVDSHTHLIAGPPRVGDFRNSGERSASRGAASSYNAEHIRRTAGPSLAFQAKKYLQGFLRHGTTTVEVKTGYGQDETGEMKMLRVISQLAESGFGIISSFLTPHTPPPEFTGNLEAYLVWIRDHVLPKVKSRRLAQFVDTFCDPSAYSVQHANTLLHAARRLGFETKIHAEQSVRLGAVRMAVEMGATSVDGLNQIDKSDAIVLGQSQTVGVVMPAPMFQGHASRMPPARMLIDEGAPVALASGFNPSVSATYNMMTVIAIACTHMGMTVEEAISAATINGAFAVMGSPRIGSLVFGKDADLIMLGVSDYREIPYQFGLNLVALTMRKGQVVYREGAVEL